MTKQIVATEADFLLYTTPDGEVKISALLQNETIWLSQKSMAGLFDTTVSNINIHLKNVFETGELDENSVIKDFLITASDGKKYTTKHYNLDAIISVGYRVNSIRGTQFRMWATRQLKEFIIKGFVMDDDRLKNPNNPFGKDYFEEVLERIRDIRSSERRFYQKITDIYTTSVDYNKNAELTRVFFATVQNKMHFGIHGKTAAEVIAERVDGSKANMGMTCFPKKGIRKSDISVAKNYLTESELGELNLIVDQYLSFAELQARNNRAMTMQDWVRKLDDFLRLNEKEILNHRGKITQELAETIAEKEFEKFKVEQSKTFESDFDREVKKLEKGKGK